MSCEVAIRPALAATARPTTSASTRWSRPLVTGAGRGTRTGWGKASRMVVRPGYPGLLDMRQRAAFGFPHWRDRRPATLCSRPRPYNRKELQLAFSQAGQREVTGPADSPRLRRIVGNP